MKKTYTLFALLSLLLCFGQIPNGYYGSATGTGYTLKTQLYNIIKDHNDKSYSGLYTTYLTSDRDFFYENNGTMLDMYTENPTSEECEFTYGINQDDGTLGNVECQRYNREHLVPQSVYNSITPMYSDAHFVVPSDKYVNAQRGDLPFGRVNVANNTYSNGTKRGPNLNSGYSAGYSLTVFEPIDEFKGDIARMLLYFAVRYENLVSSWSYPMFNGTSNQVFTSHAINVLLTWHNNDPVSPREIARNNAIYERQENRNPFIDIPAYAMSIWGNLLTNETNETFDNSVSLYPNPSNGHNISINSEIDITSIEVVNIKGQLIMEFINPIRDNTSYTIYNIPTGFYIVRLTSDKGTVSKKIIIN
jgi:endonuclease I